MEWKKIKTKLENMGYCKESITKIKAGTQLPTALKLFELKDMGVPFNAWLPYVEKYKENKTLKP